MTGRASRAKGAGAERDALAAEVERLRKALECRTVKGIDDAKLGWTVVGILIKHGKTERYIAPGSEAYRIALAALSPQPPAASPSAPEGDSELERRIQKLEQMVDGIRCFGRWFVCLEREEGE